MHFIQTSEQTKFLQTIGNNFILTLQKQQNTTSIFYMNR